MSHVLERENVLDVDCQSERKKECSERLFASKDKDCTEIVKLYSPQTKGNKECEAHRCLDFLK